MKNVNILFSATNIHSDHGYKEVEKNLLEAQLRIQNWTTQELLQLIDLWASHFINPSFARKVPNTGLPFLGLWARKKHLSGALDLALRGNAKCLDNLYQLSPKVKYQLFAKPKGLISHWMSGNVPTLPFLSLIQAMLTKNASIIRLSQNDQSCLPELLKLLSSINTDNKSGKELAETCMVVTFPHDNKQAFTQISKISDLRVIWGSKKVVDTIRKIETKEETEDVIFGPKQSAALIANYDIKGKAGKNSAKLLANDIMIYGQRACASPHTVFIETSEKEEKKEFIFYLQNALNDYLNLHSKQFELNQKTIYDITSLRTEYDMFHEAYYDDNMNWTILVDDEITFGPIIGSNTIFLRSCPDLNLIIPKIPNDLQTIGVSSTVKKKTNLIDQLINSKIYRISDIGSMTLFESPWNGRFLFEKCVNWVTCPC